MQPAIQTIGQDRGLYMTYLAPDTSVDISTSIRENIHCMLVVQSDYQGTFN